MGWICSLTTSSLGKITNAVFVKILNLFLVVFIKLKKNKFIWVVAFCGLGRGLESLSVLKLLIVFTAANVAGLHWCNWSAAGSGLAVVLWTAREHRPIVTADGEQQCYYAAQNTQACWHACRQVWQRSMGNGAESDTDIVEETQHGMQITQTSWHIIVSWYVKYYRAPKAI